MGLRQLAAVQTAPEATPGTPITPATAKWMALDSATWHEELTKDRPEELRQSLARYFSSATTYRLATIDTEQSLTYEDFPFILQAAIKKVSPTADMGMPNPAYTWLWRPTLTAPDTPMTYTTEVGDDTQVYSTPYTFCRNFELNFTIGERTRLRASFAGRQFTEKAGGFTALGERPIQYAVSQMWLASFVDAGVGASPGAATTYTGCIVNGTWRLPQTFTPHRCIDGTTTFQRVQQVALSPELELTVEFDAAAKDLRTKFENDVRQLIRLRNVNATAPFLIHAGTPSVYKRITIDGAYQITDWGAVGGSEQDGVQTLRIMASGEYDPDWPGLFEIEVVNGVPGTAILL